jgi:Uma2 family endonuclease
MAGAKLAHNRVAGNLSPSTRDYDRGAKREHYQSIASLEHLLLVDQPAQRVEHHQRIAPGVWSATIIESGAPSLPNLTSDIPLEELYRFVE